MSKKHLYLSTTALAGLLLSAIPATAQNTTCPDRPAGDISNACANTRFVSGGSNFIKWITPQSLHFKCDNTPEVGITQAGHDAVSSTGGVFYIPPGSLCVDSTSPTITKPNFTILGVGNYTFRTPPSLITYSGTAPRYIDARNTEAFRIDGMGILYSSSGFTGSLIDVSGNSGVTVSALPSISNTRLGPDTDRTGTATLVNATSTVNLTLDKVFFYHGAPAFKGRQAIADANVRTTIVDSFFSLSDTIPINGCGESMFVSGTSFEPLTNGQAGAMIVTNGNLFCKAFAFEHNWLGDVTVTGGTWIDAFFQGFGAKENQMAGLGIIGGTGITLRGPSTGVNMDSNRFELLDTAINIATANTGLGLGTQNSYPNTTTPITNPSNVVAGDFAITSAGLTVLSTVNSNVGVFGSATQASQYTVNAKGLLTTSTNVTITPAIGSVTGLGTGVGASLSIAIGSPGAPVTFNGALGTPASGIGTNITNVNAATLGGATFAAPGAIGGGTPSTGVFTSLTASISVSSPVHTATGAFTFQSNGSTFAGSISTGQLWYLGSTSLTPASGTTLTASQNTGGSPTTSVAGNILGQFIAADSAAGLMTIDTFGNSGLFASRYANGTQASKTALSGATSTFSFLSQGWDGSAWGSGGTIDFLSSASSWSGSNRGMRIRFRTVTDGTTTLVERLSITDAGGLNLGSTIATLATSEFGLNKITASGSAPGTGACKESWVAGTNAGTCKKIAYCGTSTTPTAIIDNVGGGC